MMGLVLSIRPIDSVLMHKLLIIFSVGFPGLNRLILFAIVSSLATTQELGHFANDFAIAQLASVFTSVGWGTLLTVRSAQDLKNKGEQAASSISVYAILLLLLAIPVMALLSQFGLVFSALWTWLYLAGWSGFNLLRTKCIGANDHTPLLVVEVLIVSGTVCLVGLFWKHGPVMMLAAIPFLATGLLWLIWKGGKCLANCWSIEGTLIEGVTARRGLEYGLANFASAGLFSQLPILAAHSGSISQAGLIGTLLSMVAVMDLVPASITAYFLPQIARYFKDKDYSSYAVLLERQKGALLLGLVGVMGIGISGWVALRLLGHPLVASPGANYSFALLLACYFLNHLSSPAANYFQARERSDLSIRINTATYLAFWILYLLPVLDGIVSDGLKPLVVLLILVAVRSAGMRWLVNSDMARQRASENP
jgi:O-antigen/teichoic acid export membrane protein